MQARGSFSGKQILRIPLALEMTAKLLVSRYRPSQIMETICFDCFYFRSSGTKPS
jgi:hypothetical protein